MADDVSGDRVPLADEPDLRLHAIHVEPLAKEIAGLVARLVVDTYTCLIIEVPPSERYVQFLTHGGAGLVAESIGDVYADQTAGGPFTAREHLDLVRLGWNVPDTDHPNFWRKWEPPDVFDAAQLAALTLLRVHRYAGDADVWAASCGPVCHEPDSVQGLPVQDAATSTGGREPLAIMPLPKALAEMSDAEIEAFAQTMVDGINKQLAAKDAPKRTAGESDG